MDLTTAAGAIATAATATAGVVYLSRGAWRTGRRIVQAVDDILGDPADDARPGVVKRLDRIESQLGDHLAAHDTDRRR